MDLRKGFHTPTARFALAAVILTMWFSGAVSAQTTTPPATQGSDIDALNYVLTLEYLQATYYNQFVGTTGGTNSMLGTVTGNPRGFSASDALSSATLNSLNPTLNGRVFNFLTALREQSLSHVQTLRTEIQRLGGTPVQPCAYTFTNVTNFESFLSTAQALSNTTTSAIEGAINRVSDKTELQTLATMLSVNARQAAFLNILMGGLFSTTATTPSTSSIPGVGSSPFPNAFGTALSQQQVLAVNASYLGACATSLPASAAIATFAPVIPTTISNPSFSLTATPATSMPGATFTYQVSPGGKIPAILQVPNSPQATFQFVNGAGVYNLLLVITDANGVKTTMPFSLNYQPGTGTGAGTSTGTNP